MPLIAATSDVHSPRFLLEFVSALKKRSEECKKSDIIVFAGDMVYKGRVEALRPVLEAVRSICGVKPIVAVFGNEEFMGLEDKFKSLYRDVTWLDDSYVVVEVEGVRLAIVGSRGSLERPTRWQRSRMPWISRVYFERIRRIEELLMTAKSEADKVILVTHYAPTWATLEGEPRQIWPEMGHRGFEAVIRRVKPDLVIHGHAHNSRKLEATIDGVRILNVAFPARRDIVFTSL